MMSLPTIEAAWVNYLDSYPAAQTVSTKLSYPVAAGDIRVTLLNGSRASRTLYGGTILLELWADPTTSDADAVALHAYAMEADSNPATLTRFTAVDADVPVENDDPDAPSLDRYQFMVSFNVRTS